MKGIDAALVLRTTELFGALDDDAVGALAKQLVPRNYRKGQPLFHQGDPGTSLFIICEGAVAVFVTSENGDRMVLTTLGATDLLGEIALLDEGSRSASAEALEPTTALALSRTAFLDLLRDQPAMVDQLLRSMGSLVRRLSEQASDFVFLDLPGRVAKAVLRLAEDVPSTGGAPVEVTVTQGRLAEMVGGSRQSVNQILQNFAGRGMLEVQGRRLIVLKPDLLARRAGLL
jgi:CRP-like cAMP-binding protein